ncbi:MAG: CDP-diacylglycerol--serine O-phosphatidyltransferase [Gemmatimonadaceae bacterium]
MHRAVVIFAPSGFTLANLMFGVLAIVSAADGNPARAGVYVVLGGVCDMFDGRIARATGTGSKFGEELDSLVDVISFGLAPALIMYFAVLNTSPWNWLFVFLFAACAALRLARFNVEHAGKSKRYFTGLPSPAAGGTLAVYYWFSQTELYTQTRIGDLPWQDMLRFIMLALSFLMISNVSYPVLPTINFRSVRGVLPLLLMLGILAGLIFLPREFFFPVAMLYVSWGVLATVVVGLMDRIPTGGGLLGVDDDEDELDERYAPQDGAPVGQRRPRPRRRAWRTGRPTPRLNRAVDDQDSETAT